MMRVSRETGRSSVQWQDAGHERRCSFAYHAPAASGKGANRYAAQDAICSESPTHPATASGNPP